MNGRNRVTSDPGCFREIRSLCTSLTSDGLGLIVFGTGLETWFGGSETMTGHLELDGL